MNCSADGFSKIYHTLLHLENPYEAVFISTNKHDFSKSDKFYPFLQVISIKVAYVVNTTVVTALLNSGSGATLIASELTKTLKLKETIRVNTANAILMSVLVKSKLVGFSTY